MGKNNLVLFISVSFFILLGIQFISAQVVDIQRTPDFTIIDYGEIEINLTYYTDKNQEGIIITEKIPSSLTILNATPDYDKYNSGSNEYSWLLADKTGVANSSIYYSIMVPENVSVGNYSIEGIWKSVDKEGEYHNGIIASGIISVLGPYCGDGSCNAGETCSSCSQDCGSCPPSSPPGGGGGGFTSCTENWTCTSWSSCVNGVQTRTCTDQEKCGTTTNKPNETQSCAMPILPTQNCTPDDVRCSDNDLQQCKSDGSAWETLETCEHGCSENECNVAPITPEGPDTGGITTGLILGVEPTVIAGIVGVIFVVIGVVYWLKFRKNRYKSTPIPPY